jgi:hypothetical protein
MSIFSRYVVSPYSRRRQGGVGQAITCSKASEFSNTGHCRRPAAQLYTLHKRSEASWVLIQILNAQKLMAFPQYAARHASRNASLWVCTAKCLCANGRVSRRQKTSAHLRPNKGSTPIAPRQGEGGSERTGCAWQTRATSSQDAPYSMARTASPIISPAA